MDWQLVASYFTVISMVIFAVYLALQIVIKKLQLACYKYKESLDAHQGITDEMLKS